MPVYPEKLVDGLVFFTYQKASAPAPEPYVIWAGADYAEMLKGGYDELDHRIQTGLGGIRAITEAYRAYEPLAKMSTTASVMDTILRTWPQKDPRPPKEGAFIKVSSVLVPGGSSVNGVQYLTGAKLAGGSPLKKPASLQDYIKSMTPTGCYRTFLASEAQYLAVGADALGALEAWDLFWNEPLLGFITSMEARHCISR
jgi:hypothetical protein